MRDILFKAKRIDNGEWVEGNLLRIIDGTYIVPNDTWFDYGELMDCKAVVPETICQYTGLTDKNGNKIWENDVVKISERGIEISGGFIAFFNEYPGGWLITDKYKKSNCSLAMRNDVEVIGNIFDNPELLEGGAENE